MCAWSLSPEELYEVKKKKRNYQFDIEKNYKKENLWVYDMFRITYIYFNLVPVVDFISKENPGKYLSNCSVSCLYATVEPASIVDEKVKRENHLPTVLRRSKR